MRDALMMWASSSCSVMQTKSCLCHHVTWHFDSFHLHVQKCCWVTLEEVSNCWCFLLTGEQCHSKLKTNMKVVWHSLHHLVGFWCCVGCLIQKKLPRIGQLFLFQMVVVDAVHEPGINAVNGRIAHSKGFHCCCSWHTAGKEFQQRCQDELLQLFNGRISFHSGFGKARHPACKKHGIT